MLIAVNKDAVGSLVKTKRKTKEEVSRNQIVRLHRLVTTNKMRKLKPNSNKEEIQISKKARKKSMISLEKLLEEPAVLSRLWDSY